MEKLSSADKVLHDQFAGYGRNSREWMRKCVVILPVINRRMIWKKRGFSSIYEYAAKLAGMSRVKVDEALRIMRKTENLPNLRKVIENKGIWAVKPVISLAGPQNDKELADRASEMSQHTLIVYAKEMRNRDERTKKCGATVPKIPLSTIGANLTNLKPESLLISIDHEIANRLRKIKGDGDWDFAMRLLLSAWDQVLKSEKPESVETKSRHIPNNIRRYIMKRSNCFCEFPGCGKKYAQLHHADGFSLVWCHDPDRIFALCREHHELVHHGLIENEQQDIQFWRFGRESSQPNPRYAVDRLVIKFRNQARGP